MMLKKIISIFTFLAIARLSHSYDLNSETIVQISQDVHTRGNPVEDFIFKVLDITFHEFILKKVTNGCAAELENIILNDHNLFWIC